MCLTLVISRILMQPFQVQEIIIFCVKTGATDIASLNNMVRNVRSRDSSPPWHNKSPFCYR
jgi:hypothetical protein